MWSRRAFARVALLLAWAFAVGLASACAAGESGGSRKGEPPAEWTLLPSSALQGATSPSSVTPSVSASPEAAVVGRGSAGPDSREVQAPQSNNVVDTGGLPTVVFVDADG